jgi:hypothetical protein
MAKDHGRVDAELVQGALLEDPSFLKEIVERVFRESLEAEMNEHVGGRVVSQGVLVVSAVREPGGMR